MSNIDKQKIDINLAGHVRRNKGGDQMQSNSVGSIITLYFAIGDFKEENRREYEENRIPRIPAICRRSLAYGLLAC